MRISIHRHPLVHLLVVGFFIAVSLACSDQEIQHGVIDCDTNDDCEEGFCIDGECSEGECVDNEDCTPGICDSGVCVKLQFGDECEEDGDCESEICVDGEDDERVCSKDCWLDVDCSDDGSWTCISHDDHGGVCVPFDLPPADGSTLCGAGGVSEGDGVQLTHCLAPYDQGFQDLQGDGARLESGGFKIITE